MNTRELLTNAFQEQIKALTDRKETIYARLEAIGSDTQPAILEAQIKVLNRRIDDALAMGTCMENAKLTKERDRVEAELALLTQKNTQERDSLNTELEQIEQRILSAATMVMHDCYPTSKEEWFKAANSALDTLDDIKAGFNNFAYETKGRLPANFELALKPTCSNVFGDELYQLYLRFAKLLNL